MALTEAYIAGFFDGEGSVSSYIGRRKSGAPCPHLSMAQKDPEVLRQIRDFLGYGTLWGNRLTIRGRRNILHFTKHVGPHLIIRRHRVLLAARMAILVGKDNSPTTPTAHQQRQMLADEIRRLNGKEVSWH